MRLAPTAHQSVCPVDTSRPMLVAPRVETAQVLRKPQQQAGLVEVHVYPLRNPSPVAGSGCLDQPFPSRESRGPDAVAGQELPPAGKPLQGRKQPPVEPRHRFRRRTAPPGSIVRHPRQSPGRGHRARDPRHEPARLPTPLAGRRTGAVGLFQGRELAMSIRGHRTPASGSRAERAAAPQAESTRGSLAPPAPTQETRQQRVKTQSSVLVTRKPAPPLR